LAKTLRFADSEDSGELVERLKHVRRRIAMEFGVIAPSVRVCTHSELPPRSYQIRMRGDLVAKGEVWIKHKLGIGQDLEVPGVEVEHTIEPIYQKPAVWIPSFRRTWANARAADVRRPRRRVDPRFRDRQAALAELLTREDVAGLLSMARQDSPMVVQELVPNMLSLGQLRQVLQNLVKEQVPIRASPRFSTHLPTTRSTPRTRAHSPSTCGLCSAAKSARDTSRLMESCDRSCSRPTRSARSRTRFSSTRLAWC
jgi:flagellar biosynthesis protein FlhA